ncbi:MAG: ABC transporter ATP-binding protein [Bacilli bacterium]|nr:ABC transporter ATP-binding protein [Bacilli bacterium]
MIEVKNLSVSFKEQKVLDSISFSLPRHGLIAIVGPSGCGKTTLFNCLSGLLPFEGDISIDGTYINNISLTKINNFRLKNIGFIFQDFKLFTLDNVAHNISFPLDCKNGGLGIRSKRRIKDLLALVGLEAKENQSIKNLSGGEKQRVAIARALVNNPKLILADEPTGALDETNAHKIMDLLKKISESKLVIIVSHDKELVNEYVDEIIELKDGKIKDICFKNQVKDSKNLNLINDESNNLKASIPPLFLLRHTFTSIKERKWRTLLINMVTSLGLIGVGLAFSISSTISNNIKEACSNLFSENQVMMSKIKPQNTVGFECVSFDELNNIKSIYPEYISNIHSIYETNLSSFFTTQEFSIYSNKTKIDLNGYGMEEINNYQLLPNEELSIYPSYPKELKEDEVVMSLSLGMIYNICYKLQIIRTVESFISYMESNDVYLSIHVKNDNWMYEDEQIFKLKGFYLDYEPRIYHYHPLWNQYVFEETMRFPSSLNLTSSDEKPWTLKKIYYFSLFKDANRDELLKKVRYDTLMDNYLFEIGSQQYFKGIVDEDTSIKDIKNIIVFKKNIDSITPRLVNKVNAYFPECEDAIFGSYGGYLIHQDAMMMGFSNYTYFASDKELLVSTLEEYSSVPTLNNQSLNVPNDIKVGHYSKSLQNGVIFHQFKGNLLKGRAPLNLDEIVVSLKLFNSFSLIYDNNLSLGITSKEEKISEDKMMREFSIVDLKIVGIVNSDELAIYHDIDWPIDFYQSRVGVSIFSLGINTISFSLANDIDMDNLILKMKRAFPDYNVVNPLSSINEGIDEVCSYLEIAMIAFSSIAILISIFLLSMCNYLHALEIKNDLGLARCIGISGLESTRFVFYHSYLMGFFALVTASFELVVASFFISYSVAHELSVPFMFSFNPMGLLYMFLLTLVISTISSLLISIKVLRFSPIESMKV